jgi:hypothetical protein
MERVANNDEPPLGAALNGEVREASRRNSYELATPTAEQAANLGNVALAGTSETEDQKVALEVRPVEESAIDRIKRLQAEADRALYKKYGSRWVPLSERTNSNRPLVGL